MYRIYLFITFTLLHISVFCQENHFPELMNEADSCYNEGNYYMAYERYRAITLLPLSIEDSKKLWKQIICTRDSIASIVRKLENGINFLDSLQRNYESHCLKYAITKEKAKWRNILDDNNRNPNNFRPEEYVISLDLSGYGLVELPPEISKLKSLIFLDLRNNMFADSIVIRNLLPGLNKFEIDGSLKSGGRNKIIDAQKRVFMDSLEKLTNKSDINQTVYYEVDFAFKMVKQNKFIDALIFYDILKEVDPGFVNKLIPFEKLVVDIIQFHIKELESILISAQNKRYETNLMTLNRAIKEIKPFFNNRVEAFTESDFGTCEYLSFENFHINELSIKLKEFKSLKNVNLIGNPNLNWGEVFAILPKDTKVYISENEVKDFPQEYKNRIAGLKKTEVNDEIPEDVLKNDLIYVEIGDINHPATLKTETLNKLLYLKSVEHLSLMYCNLDTLPDQILELGKLKSLNLSGNNLKNLPEKFEDLKSLEELNLNGNEFDKFPIEITRLPNLRKLKIRGNSLKGLPSDIKNLQALEVIDLGGTDLKLIVGELCKIKGLKTLDLSVNKLSELPDNFNELFELTTLILRGNEFTLIPDIVLSLTSLQKLDIGNNKKEIEGEIKKLDSISNKIGKLINLTDLDLSYNSISTLPESFKKLTKLKYLDMSGNGFNNWENSKVWDMPSIEVLELRSNGIITIPYEKIFENMISLRILDLQSNDNFDPKYKKAITEFNKNPSLQVKFK